MENLENLTQLQKIAIEGEVAQALSSAIHDADVILRLYTILKKAPKELGYVVLEIAKNLSSVSEEKLNKVIAEVSSEEVPVWIWTDKVLSDLKFSLKMSVLDKNLTEAKIEKKKVQEKILTSSFVYFCRSVAVVSPEAGVKLCEAVLKDESNKLNFLQTTCFSLIQDIKELPPKKDIPEKILFTSINVQNILSYQLETKIISENNKTKRKNTSRKNSSTTEDTPVEVSPTTSITASSLDEGIEMLREMGILKNKKDTEYSVIKYYKELGISTTLKSFKTEEEAIQYVANINRNFPDLLKTCNLVIQETSVQKGKKK